jgi:hypothetical protein
MKGIARFLSILAVAGCVGEIGESVPHGTQPSTGGSSVPVTAGGGADGGAAGTTGAGSNAVGGGGAAGTGATAGTGVDGRGGAGGSGVAGMGDSGRGGGIGAAGRGGGSGGGSGTTGRGGGGGGTGPDPFTVPATCTSGTMWTQANRGSADMNPGRACIACHSTMNGPTLTIAGTVYPTAHEPDLCNGANGTNGARVTITGANGQTLTLTPGASGNFNSRTRVTLPYTAKVTYMGRERAMTAMQTSGDCNGCHTQNGANSAPGRILLP